MAVIGVLDVLFRGDSSGFSKAANDVAGKAKSMKTEVTGINLGSAFKIGAAIEGVKMLFDGLMKLWSFARECGKELGETARQAGRLGIATQDFREIKFAAKMSGVENIDKVIGKLQKGISEASLGQNDTAKSALKELGLDAKRLAELDPKQQLLAVSDALAKVGSSGDKIRLGTKLFGEEGGIEALSLIGTDKLRAGLSEASGVIGVLSDDQVKSAGRLNRAFKSAGEEIKGWGAQVYSQLAQGFWATIDGSRKLLGTYDETQVRQEEEIKLSQQQIALAKKKAEEEQKALDIKKKALEAGQSMLEGAKKQAYSAAGGGDYELEHWFNEQVKNNNATPEIVALYRRIQEENKEIVRQTVAKSGRDMVRERQQELELFGQTGRELELEKLKRKGLTDARYQEIKAINAQLDAKEKEKKANEEWEKDLERIKKELQTPFQKYNDELKKLEKALKQPRLSQEEFNQGVEKLKKSEPYKKYLEDLAKLEKALKSGEIEQEEFDARSKLLRQNQPYQTYLDGLRKLQQEFKQTKLTQEEFDESVSRLRKKELGLSDPAQEKKDFDARAGLIKGLFEQGEISAVNYRKAVVASLPEVVRNLYESTKTPVAKLQDDLEELQQYRDLGLIDDKTWKRGVQKMKGDLGLGEIKLPSVVEFGSKEAYSALVKNLYKPQENDPQIRLVNLNTQQLEEQKKTNRNLEKREEAVYLQLP